MNKKIQELLDANPQLQELEDGAPKDGSATPSAAASATQPASTGVRIKLISSSANGNKESNGASAGTQSDED